MKGLYWILTHVRKKKITGQWKSTLRSSLESLRLFSKIDKNATTDEICIEIISHKSVNLLALKFFPASRGLSRRGKNESWETSASREWNWSPRAKERCLPSWLPWIKKIFPSIYLSVHPFLNLFIYSFIRSFVRSFVRGHSFIHSFIRSFTVCQAIHPFVHSFLELQLCLITP